MKKKKQNFLIFFFILNICYGKFFFFSLFCCWIHFNVFSNLIFNAFKSIFQFNQHKKSNFFSAEDYYKKICFFFPKKKAHQKMRIDSSVVFNFIRQN